MIRKKSEKTKVEVFFNEESSFVQGIKAWVIPFTNKFLVYIILESNRKEILESRK